MRRYLLSVVFLSLTAASSYAASPETVAFAAKVRLSMAFLTQSSALAADRSENSAVRKLSSDELTTLPVIAAVIDRRGEPPVFDNQTLAMAGDAVQTGRSAAVETKISMDRFEAPVGTGALMPAAFVTVERLGASKGGAFDKLFAASQRAVLDDLQSNCEAYARTGDDPALKQVAQLEVEAIKSRLALLDAAGEAAQN